jgi:RNA-binding protein 39
MHEAKKQLEEARRDDSTCLILNLSIKCQEKEIYEFFNNHNCGKIRDIRVIRDPRSGKSKGVAYVEFYSLESVNKAIAQSGNELQGSKLRILPSKAEINRTAAHAKQLKQNKNPNEQQHQQATGAMRIFVSGLTDQLADIEEKDLRDLFAPFGEVERVEMHRDDVTGKSKGYAFVVFRNSGDAKRAIIEMDGFTLNGKKIKVQPIQAGMANMLQDNSNFDLDDESGANYLQTSQSRAILMQKLQREGQEGLGVPGVDLGAPVQAQEQPQPVKAQTSLLPTNCILLSNMFDVEEVDLAKEPTYFVDLKEEIEEECNKYGEVGQVFIEANKEGNIWVKFKDGRGASIGYQTLNNKFFSGRKILCSYVTESTFNSKLKG